MTFRVGGQEFAFDILQVERILRHVAPAPLPKAPGFLEGWCRTKAAPCRWSISASGFELDAPIREETRLMVVDLGDQRVGVLVDEVREVLRVDSTTIAAPGPMVSGLAAAYIAGIVSRPERTIIILNARKLLSSTERMALTGTWRTPDERAVGRAPSGASSRRSRRGSGPPASRRTARRSSATSSRCSSGWTRRSAIWAR